MDEKERYELRCNECEEYFEWIAEGGSEIGEDLEAECINCGVETDHEITNIFPLKK